ncbi:uncharacterized protein LOC121369629 [Gigantopelta aegis]|uniref:uncharacterized protein LOC121369629 n=1 Tax=Gigantopelta aegis TaxID=1735272 RepID=UPI001B88E312|nr:uncharacterized protein LOC121369629 [Gigantopelta aegis]XP_041350593.1 uncharacterized protein LOC121369629 [Gigantopelta aegis]
MEDCEMEEPESICRPLACDLQMKQSKCVQEYTDGLDESCLDNLGGVADKLLELSMITEDELQEIKSKTRTFETLVPILMNKGSHLHSLVEKINELKNQRDQEKGKQMQATNKHEATMQNEMRLLQSADPSEDWSLKVFLDKIAVRIDPTDMIRIKHLISGEPGFDKMVLEKLTDAWTLFTHLRNMNKLNRFNVIYLQSLLWHIERTDLVEIFADFCSENEKRPLYLHVPNSEPENGYTFVKVYIKGDISTLDDNELETQRLQVSQLLKVPMEFVFLVGMEPSNSIVLTFMVPEKSIEIFKRRKENRVSVAGISVEFIDGVLTLKEISSSNPKQTIEENFLQKQLQELLKKEKKLKTELDQTSLQLLEQEKTECLRVQHQALVKQQTLMESDLQSVFEESNMYREMFHKALQVMGRLNISNDIVKNGISHSEVPMLKIQSCLVLYRKLLAEVQSTTLNMGAVLQLLDVKSALSAMQERQKFVDVVKHVQDSVHRMERRTGSLQIENYILHSTVVLTGMSEGLFEQVILREDMPHFQERPRFGLNVVCSPAVVEVAEGISPRMKQFLREMSKELTPEECNTLRANLKLDDREKQLLETNSVCLLEVALIKELLAGKGEGIENMLHDILGTIDREDLINKYSPQQAQANVRVKAGRTSAGKPRYIRVHGRSQKLHKVKAGK